ncbi:MAG: hypothetical protein WAN65_01685 [Candidatus Sulfotelmatobacter sp.]
MEDIYSDAPSRAKIVQLFALSVLFNRGVRISPFPISDLLANAIVPSAEGQELVEALLAQNPKADRNAAIFALFLAFGHTQVLLDLSLTDTAAIERELESCCEAGRIRYPWIYGHVLYDAAFKFSEIRDELSTTQCEELLNIAPGVFQLGHHIVGPLGLCKAGEMRFMPPRLDLPLWHCANPSCSGLHLASLPQQDRVTRALRLQFEGMLRKQHGVSSNWFAFHRALIFGGSAWYYDDFSRIELPWFRGQCVL